MKSDSRHNRENQRIAFVGLLVLLLPIFSLNLFNPLARAFPSLFSEWNAPKPRHLPHLHFLQVALRRHIVSSLTDTNLTSGFLWPTKGGNPVFSLQISLLGYRAYKNLKTIRPNMALLGKLCLNKSMEWPEFQQLVQDGHKNGKSGKKCGTVIYTYPARDCMCKV